VSSGQRPRIVPLGDSAVIVEFEERIDVAINAQAVALARRVLAAAIPGVRDVVPTFRSVAVYFDPLRTDYDILTERLALDAGHVSRTDGERATPEPREPIRVPVCYGGAFGPDLADVAAFAGLTERGVADLHAATAYRVFMLGFLPGFAYMGTVDPRIAAPRRPTPRPSVPAGSVGIAGVQTGIYPSESPGGWQLIGRTPLRVFDSARAEPSVFAAGDLVQFYTIEPADFDS
jgi:inhibitor of KinA